MITTMAKERGADHTPAPASGRAEIDAFLEKARALTAAAPHESRGTGGRLIFALDATFSRQPTWDLACRLQADMFLEAGAVGGLDIQLVYYRGFDECRASRWFSNGRALASVMGTIDCRAGITQIGKVLAHARTEAKNSKVHALVFVGDAMEEKSGHLCALAGELGLLGVPVFVFQEGSDQAATQTFREIARLSNGAHCRFSADAAHELADLLRAAAAYAAGGRKALDDLSSRNSAGARKLLQQLR
jgi:hypothetical protein